MEKKTWFEENPKKTYAIIFTVFLLIVEICMRILTANGIIVYQKYPTNFLPVYYNDINRDFGVWRYANAEFRHSSPCFDVLYQSNSYGARDIERKKKSKHNNRVIVLGDSYVDGWGVDLDKRMTNLIEKESGIEFLNFGTAGSFGSIQEMVLYDTLASKFDHSEVFIFFLPKNDFNDNDPNHFNPKRYRPYLKDDGDTMSVYYTTDFDSRKLDIRKPGKTIKNIIDNQVYTLNFLRWVSRELKTGHGKRDTSPSDLSSSYDNYTDIDMKRLLHTYEMIAKKAGPDKTVRIFTIPIAQDFNYAVVNGFNFKLNKDMKAFADKHPNIYYYDLLPFFVDVAKKANLRYKDYTLICDGHWGESGHALVANAVMKLVYGQK